MSAEVLFTSSSPHDAAVDRSTLLKKLNGIGGSQDSRDWSNTATPSTPSSIEDYDALQPEPDTIVAGGVGGGYVDAEASTNLQDSLFAPGSKSDGELKTGKTAEAEEYHPRTRRRLSVQVVLEKTSKKGYYKLTADDPEVREILRHRVATEGDDPSGKGKTRIRDLVFTRQFTTFDRQNPASAESPFHGFFTLFWLAMGLLLIRVAAQNWRTHRSVFGGAELLHMMFERDVLLLGLTDGVMTAATALGLGLQKAIANGYLSWNRSGWIIQSLWQVFYLWACIAWTFYREWPWTHTIFIVLHALVFIMKQHSYAFYNGYRETAPILTKIPLHNADTATLVSQVHRRKHIMENLLQQIEDAQTPSTPTPTATATGAQPLSPTSTSPRQGAGGNTSPASVARRRSSFGPKASTNIRSENSEISTIAASISSGEPLSASQLAAFSGVLQSEISALATELRGKCTSDPAAAYPRNLTAANFADWTVLPTLVYELEYPRQERVNWWYVAEKSAATLGVIWVMMVISQAYIYPAVALTVAQKRAGLPLAERWREFPWILSDMLFPLLLEQLLTWYVIWECLLNVLAEVTRFADRGFYGAWWNSVSWDQYARDWNRPVHAFLLRHVYRSSISAGKLSRTQATLATFAISAAIHELVMFCLFGKVRGYLAAMQLSQVPLAMLSRTRFMKGRDVLGNLIFWIGLFVGPSLITSLYLIV